MNKKSILIQLFQLAENGELKKLEQKDITEALFSYGISLKPQEVNSTFEKIRTGTRTLLNDIESCIDSSLSSLEEFHRNMEKSLGANSKLPKGATIGDDNETVSFIQSLTKDIYNYSDAANATNISRQTIKKHADGDLYNLKVTQIKKSEYITRENLIEYYRAYFKKDGFNF